MALPTNADVIVVHGYWLDEVTGLGVKQANGRPATIMFDPVPLLGASATKTPNLRDIATSTYLKTRSRVAVVDSDTGYFAALLVASNDPDLDAYGGRRVTMLGEDPFVIEVPYSATSITVDAAMAGKTGLAQSSSVKAIWLTEAAVVGTPPPQPVNSFLTSTQTLATIASAIDGHNEDTSAHPDLRALAQSASVADATTSVKGKAKLLGGTADAPTVPYSAVTGAPSSLPPSGGAGGVLSGTFPNPGFATDMATQAELDAVAASIPEAARDALGAALVAGSNVTITPNDGADTITISVSASSSYSDEQAQDAFAALIAAGTHSGISFAYNDAGDALSATVAAQSWSQITGKPTFAAVATSGSASDITTGTLPDGVIPSGIARDSEVATAVANLVNSAPTTLDTLGEIATALQADESAAATLTATVGGKATAFTQSAAKTANYTAADNEIVVIDTSGGTFTITGPTSGKPFGFRWKVGTTAPTIAAPSGYTISGAASVTPGLAPSTSSGELVLWQAFSGDYQPIGGIKPQSALNAANDLRYDAVGAAATKVASVTAADGTITVAGTGTAPTVKVGSIAESQVTSLVTDLASRALVTSTRTFSHKSGGYLQGAYGLNTATTGTGTLRVSALSVDSSTIITAMGAEFSVAGDAASLFRVGIFADDGTGYPGTLLAEAPTISTGTGNAGSVATGGTPGMYLGTLASALTLPAGLYWVGGVTQGVTTTQPTLRTGQFMVFNCVANAQPSANAANVGYSQSSVTGALPSTFVTWASGNTAGSVPRIILKLQ